LRNEVVLLFEGTQKGKQAVWQGVVLEPFVMSVKSVIKVLCDKWPSTFAKYIPPALRDDFDFMTSFKTPAVFKKASKQLLENKQFLRKAFSFNSQNSHVCLLQYLTPALQNDKQVVRWALWSHGGKALRWASANLRDDVSIVQYACSMDCLAIEYASPRLRSDLQLVAACLATVSQARLFALRNVLGTWVQTQERFLTATKPDDLDVA
jgi:hypothetical protein